MRSWICLGFVVLGRASNILRRSNYNWQEKYHTYGRYGSGEYGSVGTILFNCNHSLLQMV